MMIESETGLSTAAAPRIEAKLVLDFGQGSREQSQPVRRKGESNVHPIAGRPIGA